MEQYQKSSAELINQILKGEEIDCSCMFESTQQSIFEFLARDIPLNDFREEFKEALEIKNDSIFEKQTELTRHFKINKIKTEMTFLNQAELDSIFGVKPREKAMKIYEKKCPSGMLSLSPPIFNENYDIALILVDGCFYSSSMNKYKLHNGKWILEKFLFVGLN